MQELLLKIGYFEGGLSKSPKKVKLFFFESVSFNEQDCEKQKGPGNSDQWALQFTKQVQKNSSISYVLLDRPSLMI